jgi:putative two-component system response regulator
METRDDQSNHSQSNESQPIKKALILIVDDQATIIRIMSNMLRPHYDLCVATDGQKAIDVARNMLPDLILMDNLMPNMTGVEACKILKSDPLTEKIPVIFVTSMDDKHNEVIGLNAGAVDYIPKPPSAEIVLARVNVHLNNTRQQVFINRLAVGELTDLAVIKQEAQLLIQ